MVKVVKVYDNCNSCWTFFKLLESCPLYLWSNDNSANDDDQSVRLFYTLDIIMVFASLAPYFIGFALVVIAAFRRKAYTLCQALLVCTQFGVCKVVKSLVKEPRPDRKIRTYPIRILLLWNVVRNAKSACFFHHVTDVVDTAVKKQ